MGKWGSSAACPLCLRSVFPMEAVYAADRTPYHKVLTYFSKEGDAFSWQSSLSIVNDLILQIIDLFTVLSQMHRVWKKARHEELKRARKVALLLLLLPGMQEIQITSRIGLSTFESQYVYCKLRFLTYSFKEMLQISHIYLFLPTQSLSKPFYLSYKGLSKVYTNQLFEWVIIFVILCTITHFDSYPTSQGPVSSAQ